VQRGDIALNRRRSQKRVVRHALQRATAAFNW
jgi:hypothetical protein